MKPEDNDLLRFQTLLPFYLNNTLNLDERHFVTTYLYTHPEARAFLKFDDALHSSIKAQTFEFEESQGLKRLLTELKKQGTVSTWQRMLDWLSEWGITPAFGCVALLLVMQTGLIITAQNQDFSALKQMYRGGFITQAQAPDFKLMINPNANFADFTLLLQKVKCQIVAGPSDIGELTVACDAKEQLQITKSLLDASTFIDDVIPLVDQNDGAL